MAPHSFQGKVIVLFYVLCFVFFCGGIYKSGGQSWRDRDMSEIIIHDVKFTKNNNLFFKERKMFGYLKSSRGRDHN